MFERRYFERVVCADGFSVSVQANEHNYCTPRNSVGPWSSVECGFPTAKDPVLEKWAEDPDAEVCKETGHVQTVYGWVPSQVILKIIESHGGMVSGALQRCSRGDVQGSRCVEWAKGRPPVRPMHQKPGPRRNPCRLHIPQGPGPRLEPPPNRVRRRVSARR